MQDVMKKCLVSRGKGSMAKLEVAGGTAVALRALGLKSTDFGGVVTIGLDSHREQIIRGHRFSPVTGQWRLRSAVGYKITTRIDVTEPFPKGVRARIVLNPELVGVFLSPEYVLPKGFTGSVDLMVIPHRKTELGEDVLVGYLVFEEGDPIDTEDVEVLVPGEEPQKDPEMPEDSGESTKEETEQAPKRTKRSSKSSGSK